MQYLIEPKTDHRPLTITRLRGQRGPIFRVAGDLTLATSEALRRELQLVTPAAAPIVLLDLSRCRKLDFDGVILILEQWRALERCGSRLALISRNPAIYGLLQTLAIDALLPVAADETAAHQTLGCGEPQSCREAAASRGAALARWTAILRLLDFGSSKGTDAGWAPMVQRALEVCAADVNLRLVKEALQTLRGRGRESAKLLIARAINLIAAGSVE